MKGKAGLFPRVVVYLTFLIVAATGAIGWAADAGGTAADSNLDLIRYKTPAGWQVTDRAGQGARVLTAPDSNAATQAMILLIVIQPQDGFDLRSAFDATVKQVTGTGKVVEAGDVVSSKSRQGFDALTQTLVTENPAGQHVHARIVAAKVQNRMAAFFYLSNDDALYQKHQPEVDAMLRSVSFDVAPANAAVADTATILAKAKERFAHEVDARRKPHVVLGDVLGLDGKPIPNVEAASVQVWGTTIAAERTQYALDVDSKGHFEQQIPDGLYKLYAKCTAKVGGHEVPLDLIALDGRKSSVDQASSTGIVADFRMVMEGLKPEQSEKDPRSFFGGLVNVCGPAYTLTTGDFGSRHPNAKVRLTFTPKSEVADGSRCETFTREINASDANYTAYLKCLPIAVYSVSAKLIEADGSTRPMWCAREFAARQYTESVEVYWESAHDAADSRASVMVYLKE
jgi:hypothetical protein